MSDLTVVIPVYNVKKYLRRCIGSVLSQTLQAKYIILVDDGSVDGSGQICDEYAERYSYIQVIHQKNQGLSAARNAGIDATKTEYVTFVDSDDYIDPMMYENLMSFMKEKNADISIGGVWIEQEDGKKRAQHSNDTKLCLSKKQALIELNSYKYFNMSFCDKIFKTNLFENLRFPVGKLCEDYYLMHKIVAKAEKIVYNSAPYYHYIQRQNSISRNKKINLAPIEVSFEQLKFYEENYPELSYVAKTACVFSHMGIYSAYARNGLICPSELVNETRGITKKYLSSVLKNKYIPNIKKVQAITYCYCLPIYKFIIKRRLHR
ncbi:glycosyltransferase family 2 protein [Amedibacillus sp. YH-ame6]